MTGLVSSGAVDVVNRDCGSGRGPEAISTVILLIYAD
jgi:hypothetical protein